MSQIYSGKKFDIPMQQYTSEWPCSRLLDSFIYTDISAEVIAVYVQSKRIRAMDCVRNIIDTHRPVKYLLSQNTLISYKEIN